MRIPHGAFSSPNCIYMSVVSKRQVLILYKRLLKLQRRMPVPLNTVGVEYIREEFRLHKEAGPDHAQSFLQEWQASTG